MASNAGNGSSVTQVASSRRSLSQVQDRIGTSRGTSDLSQRIHFCDQWASDYDQDVAILDYRAPRLAMDCLASVFPFSPQEALLLGVACGTRLVAVELQKQEFCNLHGVEGSKNMLELAKRQGLYQQLSLLSLGQEALPAPSDHYDAAMVGGALSDGQVPYSTVSELLPVTNKEPPSLTKSKTLQYRAPILSPKSPSVGGQHLLHEAFPGSLVCLSTRANPSNLTYKEALETELARLEQAGRRKRVLVRTVDQWERATSEQEAAGSSRNIHGFISGVIYLYCK
ncbi:LOW QUALITY PROTEIN: methyltransferase-like protein 27 [Trichosurus vulpecula]|uniref:LOW QUALITY PROTEIN: methyltransferase-like protein 27 n=1 Tax=Trichosurus vulpecula TaxID=9337 RepID=UPI00186B1F37|nr:LOW QUALITY PROTEIN: methyltransferase-like protein 27 [Trichosurus vulpecula]